MDPSFQCVVHVRAAELESAPLPFLNRFEKYRLSQADLLAVVMKALPASMKEVIELAMAKVSAIFKIFLLLLASFLSPLCLLSVHCCS